LGLKEIFVLPVAKHWISGADQDAAIKDAKRANSRGMGVVVNFLGEETTDMSEADRSVQEYMSVQKRMASEGVDGFASVKLTQFGLLVDEAEAAKRATALLDSAGKLGQNLWVDMERSSVVDATLRVYSQLVSRSKRVGVALQSYLKRSEADLNSILDMGGTVRLVKGAYKEGADVSYPHDEVNEHFRKMMATLFERGDNFAIGTHDNSLIKEAKRMAEKSGAKFRFEMLKGIREDLKPELIASGYKVSEYLPYGDRWYAYSMRRIKEHPSNVWLLLRSIV
jgi:proline dehydrogenase